MVSETTRSIEAQNREVLAEPSKSSQARRVIVVTVVGFVLALIAAEFVLAFVGTDSVLVNQDHRRLFRPPKMFSLGDTGAITCHEILTKQEQQQTSTTRKAASRRSLRTTTTSADPYYYPQHLTDLDQRENNMITLDPELQRVDHILREVYNKDLVVDVTDEAMATTSLYAAAYGWPVLTLLTNQGHVQNICESTTRASTHYVLPAWTSTATQNNNNLAAGSSKVANVPLDQLETLASLPRIRLLHIAVQQGEWQVLQGASKLLKEGRIEHVLVSLHFTQQMEEAEAVQVLTTLLASGYLPMDEKDRKISPQVDVDAKELLRQMIKRNAGTSTQVWFYRNHLA